jgi:hypothetical protein
VVRYKPLDADRAQALSVNAIDASASAGTARRAAQRRPPRPPATLPEHALVSPLVMGIGGIVVLAIIIMMVTRRRPTDEAFHIG